jgi:hypothetical protein
MLLTDSCNRPRSRAPERTGPCPRWPPDSRRESRPPKHEASASSSGHTCLTTRTSFRLLSTRSPEVEPRAEAWGPRSFDTGSTDPGGPSIEALGARPRDAALSSAHPEGMLPSDAPLRCGLAPVRVTPAPRRLSSKRPRSAGARSAFFRRVPATHRSLDARVPATAGRFCTPHRGFRRAFRLPTE